LQSKGLLVRWVFLTLLLLNVLVFGVQWMEHNRPITASYPPIPEDAERIKLLSEEQGRSAASAPDAVYQSVGMEDGRLCMALGPYGSESEAARVVASLVERAVDAAVLTSEIQKAPDYWVYLEPMDNRNAAIKKLRELQQVRKIDSYLISQGVLANGISLGLFKTKDAAQALQRERVRQGLDAKLAEVERTVSEYWVATKDTHSEELLGRVNKILAEKKLSAEHRQIFCKSIASNGKLS
jgi:hypothetical protein